MNENISLIEIKFNTNKVIQKKQNKSYSNYHISSSSSSITVVLRR